MSKELLAAVDARAAALHMDRSTYLRQICLKEIGGGLGGGISNHHSPSVVGSHNSVDASKKNHLRSESQSGLPPRGKKKKK